MRNYSRTMQGKAFCNSQAKELIQILGQQEKLSDLRSLEPIKVIVSIPSHLSQKVAALHGAQYDHSSLFL